MYYNLGVVLFCLISVYAEHKELRLVDGVDVNIIDYPYQLLLRTESLTCGASIIGSNWALTSASCIDGAQFGVIRSGITKINLIGNRHEVLEFHIHPNWTTFGGYDYDFGLLKVKQPFKLNTPGVGSIQLADKEAINGSVLTISGWGAGSYAGMNTIHLQAANLTVISYDTCQMAYGKLPITDRMMCAGSNAQGTCTGDWGSPLVDRITGVQYGIVSFIPKSCSIAFPSVFANIADQRDWIRNTTGI